MPNPKILVVEDETIVALDIKSRLESLGFVVPAVAASGEEAIQKATETHPDLVLMDIKLKGKQDGVEAAEEIRAQFQIPVIYLTAYADEATLQRAKITEPFGYILKPFEGRELHSAIEMALYKHQAERRLRESEQWLSTILRSIGDAVIATDASGCVNFMNPVAEALTQWKQEDAFGKDVREVLNIISGGTRRPIESLVAKVLEERRIVDLEGNSLLVARDGTEIPVDDTAAPIMDDEGSIIGVVLVFQDVTERKRAEDKLAQYTVELEARNEELDAFARTVAHDLQNPLSAVIGFAEVLKKEVMEASDDRLRVPARAIERYARKMDDIIRELLLLARVRQEQIQIQPLDMATIIAEAQQRLTHMMQEHQAEIISPGTWPATLGYGPWVEEVWVNYLSNAIKYGGRPPRIELGATTQPDGAVRFWVRDNGPGIPPEAQSQLFTPFTRLERIDAEGHGLGLSIVQRIVEKLGGQVGVESSVRQGSEFYFTLPGAKR